jgi:uncharacterized protein YndB with AHSA1/START domain
VPAAYHFVDRWFVPFPVEDVYDVIGDAMAYPAWWGDVFLEIGGDDGPPHPGRRSTITAKGFLPYKLHFASEVVAAERPKSIRMTLEGDFEGGGEWTLEPAEGGTNATLDWRPIVNKPLVKNLTPVLRPLFRSNHTWTMKRGEKHIADYLAQRRSAQ